AAHYGAVRQIQNPRVFLYSCGERSFVSAIGGRTEKAATARGGNSRLDSRESAGYRRSGGRRAADYQGHRFLDQSDGEEAGRLPRTGLGVQQVDAGYYSQGWVR